MGVLRVDHPDIEEFIRAKRNETDLRNFNISIGITDEFMQCVERGTPFDLVFEGRVYRTLDARALWDEIMRSTWDWAEPGVLFIDRINQDNPLFYAERIEATNPCGEQPLPPYGACLLGSFNLVKYVNPEGSFNFDLFKDDIPHIVRAMDNVVDRTEYPLVEQRIEAESKRRMGLGITGLANTVLLCGYSYADNSSLRLVRKIMKTLCLTAYEASSDLAAEKGMFPTYTEQYLDNEFMQKFPDDLKAKIKQQGMRNSHLISIAPTGTISFTADNISSGIEPVFAYEVHRTVQTEMGPVLVPLKDYVWNYHGLKDVTADELTVDDHLNMQIACQPWVDSAISKTINVGDDVTFDEFKDVYFKAWKGKLKGVTTFRPSGKRYGILNKVEPEDNVIEDGAACFIDPETGQKECG